MKEQVAIQRLVKYAKELAKENDGPRTALGLLVAAREQISPLEIEPRKIKEPWWRIWIYWR